MSIEHILDYLGKQGTQVGSLDEIEEGCIVAFISSLAIEMAEIQRPRVTVIKYTPELDIPYTEAIKKGDFGITPLGRALISSEGELEELTVKQEIPLPSLQLPKSRMEYAYQLNPESDLAEEYFKAVQQYEVRM